MNRLLKLFAIAAALPCLLGIGSASAALIDRGGGLIYDTDRNITWLANANMNGLMTWTVANNWANNLVYGGFSDWRLPTALNADATGPCSVFNCTGSEMGHLWYTELSNTGSTFNTGNFLNLQSGGYWSGSKLPPETNSAWFFSTTNGGQYIDGMDDPYYAMAVRNGDVPEPESLLLMLLGIGGLLVLRRRKPFAASAI